MKFSATTGITLICAAGFLVVSMAHAVEPTSLPKPGGAMMKGGDKDGDNGGKGGKDKMRMPSGTLHKNENENMGSKGGKGKMTAPRRYWHHR